MKTSNSVVGKCQYCEDPVYKFQADVHDGCARIAGIREIVEWMESRFGDKVTISSIYDDPGFIFYDGYRMTVTEEEWPALKKKWGLTYSANPT